MKILQINCVYPNGSTGRITQALHRQLKAGGNESLVIYGRGQQWREPDVVKLCPEWYAKANHLLSRVRGILYGGCWLSTLRLLWLVRRERPDVVHLQCINGYFVNIYRLVAWLKRHRIKTVLTLHAEFMYTGGCAHGMDCEKWRAGCGNCPRWHQETGSFFRDRTAWSFRKMEAAFRGFEEDLTVVSVSGWLKNRAEQSPVLKNKKHRVISNGVDTKLFFYRPVTKIVEKPLVFHATALFSDEKEHPKGGWALLELAEKMPDVTFLVAGKHRLSRSVPSNVIVLGEILAPGTLAEYYCMADVSLLTSRRETFSMVCAESLCCGTPVAGFLAGGPEEISLPAYSTFVPYGDMESLERVLRQWLAALPDRPRIAREAARRYDLGRMVQEYERLYRGNTHENTA